MIVDVNDHIGAIAPLFNSKKARGVRIHSLDEHG